MRLNIYAKLHLAHMRACNHYNVVIA